LYFFSGPDDVIKKFLDRDSLMTSSLKKFKPERSRIF